MEKKYSNRTTRRLVTVAICAPYKYSYLLTLLTYLPLRQYNYQRNTAQSQSTVKSAIRKHSEGV